MADPMRSRFGDAAADEVEFRDGAHGIIVWPVTILDVGWMHRNKWALIRMLTPRMFGHKAS